MKVRTKRPSVITYEWESEFRRLYDHTLIEYLAGKRTAAGLFIEQEINFIGSIGAKPTELLDYAEDADDLSWETALLISAVRRDYFVRVQHCRPGTGMIDLRTLPAKDAELDGIRWLPRLIAKANARLRGELPEELMYCCGGDRAFFRKWNIHPADFLRVVWKVDGDNRRILNFVKGRKPDELYS